MHKSSTPATETDTPLLTTRASSAELDQWGISEVLSMATNQTELRTSAMATPAPMPTFAMARGTTSGKTSAPKTGVKATNHRKATRDLDSDGFNSEPLAAGFAGGVAVVHGGFSREVESDVALLLTISCGGFNRIGLFAIPEGHLNPEGAVG